MSVLKALIAVMIMQLATTLKGVTPALATLDTQAMDILVQVRAVMFHRSIDPIFPVYMCRDIRPEWKLCMTVSFSAGSD